MANPWIAAGFALFVWWFSTGAILVVVKRADRQGGSAHVRAVAAGLPVLALACLGLVQTLEVATVAGVYIAFLSAIAIWGWFELAFLAGVLTGPNVRPCPPGVPGWERFLRAWGTIAYSEMALVATTMLIVALGWEAANPFGMWTFVILFLARISAKLNVYLGVPNINTEFLPVPVQHLASHFRVAPMNGFFPVAVTALAFAVACWLERAVAQEAGSAGLAGFALLAALTALALVEHWLMVLPLPDQKLWQWFLPETMDRGTPRRRPEKTIQERGRA
jgi:putative photosynthetic complex assembly protein 2